MGICKCRNRSELFCFVHKKSVCHQCIASDHRACVVKTYLEWLQDSDCDALVCGLCRQRVTPDNVLRLTCLCMFHAPCIDAFAANKPPSTAAAGYACPVCAKPILPSDELVVAKSAIARELHEHLSNAAWVNRAIYPLLAPPPAPAVHDDELRNGGGGDDDNDGRNGSNHSGHSNNNNVSHNSSSAALSHHHAHHDGAVPPGSPATTRTIGSGSDALLSGNKQVGAMSTIAARTSTAGSSSALGGSGGGSGGGGGGGGGGGDVDEDKYRRKSVTQMLVAFGLLRSVVLKDGTRVHKPNGMSMICLAACLTIVALFWVLHISSPGAASSGDY